MKLTDHQKEIIKSNGYTDEDCSTIEQTIISITYQLTPDLSLRVSHDVANDALGEDDYLSGITRATFHYSSCRVTNDDKRFYFKNTTDEENDGEGTLYDFLPTLDDISSETKAALLARYFVDTCLDTDIININEDDIKDKLTDNDDFLENFYVVEECIQDLIHEAIDDETMYHSNCMDILEKYGVGYACECAHYLGFELKDCTEYTLAYAALSDVINDHIDTTKFEEFYNQITGNEE